MCIFLFGSLQCVCRSCLFYVLTSFAIHLNPPTADAWDFFTDSYNVDLSVSQKEKKALTNAIIHQVCFCFFFIE